MAHDPAVPAWVVGSIWQLHGGRPDRVFKGRGGTRCSQLLSSSSFPRFIRSTPTLRRPRAEVKRPLHSCHSGRRSRRSLIPPHSCYLDRRTRRSLSPPHFCHSDRRSKRSLIPPHSCHLDRRTRHCLVRSGEIWGKAAGRGEASAEPRAGGLSRRGPARAPRTMHGGARLGFPADRRARRTPSAQAPPRLRCPRQERPPARSPLPRPLPSPRVLRIGPGAFAVPSDVALTKTRAPATFSKARHTQEMSLW